MAARGIVRDQDVMFGRWRIADTMFAVADIQSDYASRPLASGIPTYYQSLSAYEISQALDFRFNPVRRPQVHLIYGSFALACECGEDAFVTSMDESLIEITCQCGRKWMLELALIEVANT